MKKYIHKLLMGTFFIATFGFGQPSFTEHVVSNSADGAKFAYAADVDGDGDMDVLSASHNDDKIAWYENDGSESFTEHAISTSADGANSVYAADVDGDGDMDVLSSANFDDKVAWYENDGSQNFTEHVISTNEADPDSWNYVHFVYAVDVDGDDDMDVVFGCQYHEKVLWFENDGSENFTEHEISSGGIGNCDGYDVYPTDVDGDGDMDVLSVCNSKIIWYENDGSENFTAHFISTLDYGVSVYAADVDGDGDVDALSASDGDNKLAWYENDGSENFTEHVILSSADYLTFVYAADMDGDGNIDVLSSSESDNKIAWYKNDGSENFTEYVISTSADNAKTVHAMDINGDGYMDALSASQWDNKIAWYENDGTPPPDCPEDEVELWGQNYSVENTINLNLSNSGLTGPIPPGIGCLSNLQKLELQNNQLTGSIPSEIGNLTNLTRLWLYDNQLTGEIPDSICSLVENNCNINISNNQLCPPYPSCIEDYVGEQDTTNCGQVSIIDETLPITYKLYNAYPNPFNPKTTLHYDLPEDAMVNITIYDMMGRIVSNLVSSQQNAGYKSIQWNATNNIGQPVSAGVYLYSIEAGEFRQTKKMVLLK